MNTKRFVAPDMRQALKKVREEVGADAVILSNRKVPQGIEIIAAIDYETFVAQHHLQAERAAATNRRSDYANEFPDLVAEQQRQLAGQDMAAELLRAMQRQRAQQQLPASASAPAPASASMAAHAVPEAPAVPSAATASAAPVARAPAPARQMAAPAAATRPTAATASIATAQESVVASAAPAAPGGYAYEPPLSAAEAYEEEARALVGDPSADDEAAVMLETEQQPTPPPAVAAVTPVNNALSPEMVEQLRAPVMQEVSHSRDEISAMRGELNELKQLLGSQLASVAWGNFSQHSPIESVLFKRLSNMGVSAPLSERYCHSARNSGDLETAWQQCLREFEIDLPVMQEDWMREGGVIALVGPAGVGKTTTIAKLATQYVLENGPEDIALITTDSYRIAGHEQLCTLGRILNVQVRVVTEEQSLDQVIKSLSRKHLVLLDTAGLSHKDQVHADQLAMLQRMNRNVQRWLVLSTTSQRRTLEHAFSEYAGLKLTGCVLTKLDESASMGEALSLAIEHGLPVGYVTNGQNIPDDIARLEADQLIAQALTIAANEFMNEAALANAYSDAVAAGEVVAACH